MESLGYIIAIVSLVCGVLLLTGHGEFLMGGGQEAERNRIYDRKKVEKASGIALLIAGAVSVVDIFTTTMPFKIAYTVCMVVIFGGLFWYIAKKCRK